MSKEIYISSTPHETRLAIVENDALTEIYYERENEYTLAGSIYNGKVTRVLPGMQSSFVDIGLDRDAFLYITDFMEEAGDAADFESHANGRDQGRAPRDGGRAEGSRPDGARGDSRRSGGDRGGREERPQLGTGSSNGQGEGPVEVREPSDAKLFTDAVSGLDPARPVSGAERGQSRRGGRNGRDHNSDGTPRRDRGSDRGPERISGNRADAPRVEPSRTESPQPILAVPASAESSGELGEGAPGADGSRRWRGRRGRRGSRSDAPREQATASTSTLGDAETFAAEPLPIYESYADAPPEAYSPDEVQDAPEPSVPAASSADDRGGRTDRGGREDRGRGGREDRGNRGERPGQTLRVPRGFAPSTSLYQVEGVAETTPYGEEVETAAPGEPIILPGESLSKYRTGGAEPVSAAPAASISAAPAAEFVVSGWDGGMVLPGETIRPRGPRPEEPAGEGMRRDSSFRDASGGRVPRGDDRQGRGGGDSRGGNRGRDERGGRPDRQDRGDRGPRSESRPGSRTDAGLASQPEQRSYRSDPAPAAVTPIEIEPVHVDLQPVDAQVEHTAVPADVTAPTYLSAPEEVPASHLVTPSPASHPIYSTFVPPPPMPTVSSEPIDALPSVVEQEYEPTEASASYRIDPNPPSEFRQSAPVAEVAVVEAALSEEPTEELAGSLEPDAAAHAHALADTETIPAAHQLTSISAAGEMDSEPVELMTQDLTAPAPSAQGTQQSSEPRGAEIAAGDQSLPYFAPGAGLLEEETLDEEEESEAASIPRLQAHGHAEAEEETLEGAADLGSMIQEMAIDRTTRGEPSIDEDEDLLEEDQDFEESPFADAEEEDEEESEGEPQGFTEAGEFGEPTGAEGEETARELEQAAFGSAFAEQPAQRNGGDAASGSSETREPRRDGRSGDRGRRDGRRGDRNGRSGSSDRGSRSSSGSSSSSGSGDRERDRGRDRGGDRDRGRGRQSMQATNLPAISDLLKPGQEVLVQIAKEPIAKKGARITSHIALPGRFLVFMPTVHHTGVSRKIESDAERRRLKEILLSEKGEAAGGFIVRTAASGASEEELRSDLRFLLNLWTDIKNRSEGSKSPALIYHDLNLVERVLRDQVTDTFSAIWVDTETEYERVLRFLQRFQPSLIRRVKLYTKETPLFEQFGITEEINKALRSKVWLKSGGSIVINQTEALVAIDINTGKFVGKTARLEDTIVKTNLDAIPEIVRQIRLRDLGGIIIIDFIDMDDRKNRNRVMAALEDELKADRAPSKVLQFNDFGLVAITRKRVKQSLERTLSTTCGVCAGTGMVKSPVTVCNDIYIEMRKMHKHLDRGDVMLRVHPEVVKQLKSTSSRWLQEMEEMVGKTILVKSDPALHPEQFDLH